MGTLANSRHERFAQLLAEGLPASRAYEAAGYKPNDANASRLTGNDKVQARVAEILAAAAVRTEITVAGITDRLMGIADLAERTGVVKSEDTGQVVATSSKHLSVARAALMDAAKLNGLVIDKAELAGPGGKPLETVSRIVLCGPDDDAEA